MQSHAFLQGLRLIFRPCWLQILLFAISDGISCKKNHSSVPNGLKPQATALQHSAPAHQHICSDLQLFHRQGLKYVPVGRFGYQFRFP